MSQKGKNEGFNVSKQFTELGSKMSLRSPIF